MFTEQNPPCAAQLGVPNCCAHKPDSACIWSRPVKNASWVGLVERIFDKRAVRISSASSHSISTKSAAPRSLPGLRFSGFLSLAAEYCFMIPAEPLAHNTPLFTGWFRLP